MPYNAKCGDITVAVTGDSLITRPLSPYSEPDFIAVKKLIGRVDVAFTNLEVVLGEELKYPAEYCGGNWLGVEPQLIEDLTWMGFNLFSAANNHAGDFGSAGVLSTVRELDDRRIRFAGIGETLSKARQPGYLHTNSGRVALIAVTSTWPAGSAAGEQRPDIIGRPGVNQLDHEVTYKVSAKGMDMLRSIAEETDIEAAKQERIRLGYSEPDQEQEFDFLDSRFVVSDHPGTSSVADEDDLAEILKWVKDAKRQADFCFVSFHNHESQISLETPAEFVETFCRACIDAGADAVFGHGPHVLRGIEIHSGKPILYSLGNFMMQSDTMQRVPADLYERYDVDGLKGTPSELFDNREKKYNIRRDPIYWESAVVHLEYTHSNLNSVDIYPIYLGAQSMRSQKGRPLRANGAKAQKILTDLKTLSAPYGTVIEIDDVENKGSVELK